MEERVLGTETEYACLPVGSAVRLPQDSEEQLLGFLKKLASLLPAALAQLRWPRAGEYLGNGGRFYIDRGGHPEYATPECRTVRDLVVYERAGDLLLQTLVETARQLADPESAGAKLHVFKNNVDFWGHSYGAHENYLVTPKVMAQLPRLLPFLVTRQLLAGAGRVAGDGVDGYPFRISQRAEFIDRVASDRTSQVRGLLCTRKRDLVRPGQNQRLHLILGDANLSDYALYLKIGTTILVLKMLEEDHLQDIPGLQDPVAALHQISRQPSATVTWETGGRPATAWEIQSLYLERAQRYFSSRQPTPEEAATLAKWEKTLVGLRQLKYYAASGRLEDDPAELRHRLDWLLKLWLLQRAQQQHGFTWSDRRNFILDLTYHDLDPNAGLFLRSRQLGLVEEQLPEEECQRALREPPADTRAWLRGRIIQEAPSYNIRVQVDNWSRLSLLAGDLQRAHAFDRTRRLLHKLQLRLDDPLSPAQDLWPEVEAFWQQWRPSA